MGKEKIEDNIFKYEKYKNGSFKEALIITLIYGFFGLLWILFSDRILLMILDDPNLYRDFQTYKGWFFILITMKLIYILIKKRIKTIQDILKRTLEAYRELEKAHEELSLMEENLRYQNDLTENIIRGADVIIVTWDEEGKILSLNAFGEKIFGFKKEDYLNKKWFEILIPYKNREKMQIAYKEIIKCKQLKFEGRFLTKEGKVIQILWNNSVIQYPKGIKMVSIGTDITGRKKYEKELKKLAYYDSLTGLMNRVKFEKVVNDMIHKNEAFAMLYLDLDNFKEINDTVGHKAGDEFLKYIGNRMSAAIKVPNVVARMGGDEFTILMKPITSKSELLERVYETRQKVSQTWKFGQYEFYVSMSIGIALYPEHGQDITTLLKNADVAMYASKKEGKNQVIIYNDVLRNKG
jgi:diguanylate cyclase (GGDEF)-like protein/PAS domain S-box-containing protein